MRLRVAVAVVLVAAGCAIESPYVPPPLTGEGTPLHPPEEAWARVLKAAVTPDGSVDFNALMQNHQDLDRYVAWIYERSPERWPEFYRTPAHVVAFHVNAYNALVLYNLLQAGVPPSLSLLERKRMLESRKLLVGGQPLALAEYREQIRALGEPRVHFAITRQVRSDPLLAREPYRAAILDAQLDRAARAFLGDGNAVVVDPARSRVTLPPILEDYAPDFLEAAPSLAAYASRFRDAPLPAGYAVQFGEHDWDLRHAGTLPQPKAGR
jgi:hypothetical protein